MYKYLEGLNEQQRAAVLHIDGPLMIVAGAGSGKTKVLTTRIAHLINEGIDPFNILALTFTNKAAKEMKHRVENILDNHDVRNLYIGTFHSIFARLLRFDAPKLGYPNNFTIYDSDDAKSVIKTVIKEMNLDDKVYKPSNILGRISSAKNSLYTPKDYMEDRFIREDDVRGNRPLTGEIYVRYADRCFKNGAMDFDDLLFKMYELLTTCPEVLYKYQNQFKYILIDEYQDTNSAQYHIIKLLGAVHENICVVGDDAQSIYSFRGATVQNILQFQDDYDNVKQIKLEQNYRSTKCIIEVANQVISKNKNQIQKQLWTESDLGEKIKVVRTLTDNDEGKLVAEKITEIKLRHHYPNKAFAVLYRTNAQSRSFEESLRRSRIPYRLVGGVSFYQRKEVKDFLAYLRVILNPSDEENIKRIINYPARGIGKTTLDRLAVGANEMNITFWEAINNPNKVGLTGSTASKLEAFAYQIRQFQLHTETMNAYDLANTIGRETGLLSSLYNDKSVEGLQRYENIQELLNSIKEFTETPDTEGELLDVSLGAYLQQITLLTDADTQDDEDNDKVSLMTIHAAKGLEFEVVFSVGLEENLFPSQMSMFDRDDLEEERRLFYVAITRAEKELWITYASTRYRFGNLIQNGPSRFLNEIPKDYIDQVNSSISSAERTMPTRPQGSSIGAYNRGSQTAQTTPTNRPTSNSNNASTSLAKMVEQNKAYVHQPSANFKADDPQMMRVGTKIEHQKFGFGTIKKLEGQAHNPIAEIHFDNANGLKKIMLNYAKLMIVDNA